MTLHHTQREAVPENPNRLDIDGIEFVEFATSQPYALGQVLERLGFCAVARHRSREVVLYRQGGMNLVVNAHPDDAWVSAGHPILSAVAFRVGNALKAHTLCMELGAWDLSSRVQAMELHIPGIRGPGASRFYFVDRWKDFSIFDIDFVPIEGAQAVPAIVGMTYFGVVQYIGVDRSADWISYFGHMFDFTLIPDEQRFGILPKGTLMRSPCGGFMWQLIEPDPTMDHDDTPECLQRLGLGVPDVPAAVQCLQSRGVEFVESARLHPDDRGALTRTVLGSVSFELVHQAA